MAGKKIIMSVTTDVSTDQRVIKTATFLTQSGYKVVVIGRLRKKSLPIPQVPFQVIRWKLIAEKGPIFYAHYNLKLFFYLLFNRFDNLHANDLDTLLPMAILSSWKRKPLVYDSHEYFTGVPEIQEKPFVKKIWETIERFSIPKTSRMYTVCDSIAALYQKEYAIPVQVVRNIPSYRPFPPSDRKSFQLPEDKFIMIIQGSGINKDRGAEEMIEAMPLIEGALLLIVGSGDVIEFLKKRTEELNIQPKVRFEDRVPYEKLRAFTACAHLGLILDKNTNINYQFSLPNKLFDFIHAEVPMLSSPLVEISKIIQKEDIGTFLTSHQPIDIAKNVKEIIENPEKIKHWKENLKLISKNYDWNNEQKVIGAIYQGLGV